MTSTTQSMTDDPSHILDEWSYLQLQQRWLLLGLLAGLGLAILWIDEDILPTIQANTIGALVFGTALGSYALAQVRDMAGFGLAIAGLLVCVGLLTYWWALPGASVLWLLPVLLASHFLDWRTALPTAGIALAMLQWGPHPPVRAPGEFGITAFFIVLVVISEAVRQWRITSLLHAQRLHYAQAKAELDAARNQRLRLNQVNADLAAAYVQLGKLNELLRSSRLEAESARRTKEEFVANVSHELRTPLNMIIGLSEMMLNAPQSYASKLPPALLADVRVIHRNSQHLAQLVNDVLDLSQTEAGRLHLQREWVDSDQIVTEAVATIRPLFDARGLTLGYAPDADLPQVYCDRVRIRQVLLNLLSNAGRFTTHGGAVVRATYDTGALALSVSDTGPGISLEEQAHIFEPFYQASSGGPQPWHGSGLGLSICRQFVELHGGKMWLTSSPGEGATFGFTLPRHAPAARGWNFSSAERWVNSYAAQELRLKQSDTPLPPVKRTVLLLDPDHVLTRPLATYLPEVDVVVARNLNELSDLLGRTHPNLLLVNDLHGMHDRNFVRNALKLPDRLPVLSCYVPSREQAWQHLNVRGYLVKPVIHHELLATVAAIVPRQATILVVEDDPDTAHLTRRQLLAADRGYRVLTAATGQSALELLRKRTIDLLCLDLNLPDLDGDQILRSKDADARLRAIPAIVISARDPTGEPVVAGRLRIEMADGLSLRDLIRCTAAVDWALSTGQPA